MRYPYDPHQITPAGERRKIAPDAEQANDLWPFLGPESSVGQHEANRDVSGAVGIRHLARIEHRQDVLVFDAEVSAIAVKQPQHIIGVAQLLCLQALRSRKDRQGYEHEDQLEQTCPHLSGVDPRGVDVLLDGDPDELRVTQWRHVVSLRVDGHFTAFMRGHAGRECSGGNGHLVQGHGFTGHNVGASLRPALSGGQRQSPEVACSV